MIKRLIFDVDNTLIVGADFTDSIIKMTKELIMITEIIVITVILI